MKVQIKVQRTEESEMDLDTFFYTDLYFKESELGCFFVIEDEIIFIVQGQTYTTSFDVKLANKFAKLTGDG